MPDDVPSNFPREFVTFFGKASYNLSKSVHLGPLAARNFPRKKGMRGSFSFWASLFIRKISAAPRA